MKPKRLILCSTALLVIALILLILWSNHRQASIHVTLEGVQTNSAGESEYFFRVQNNAWSAFVLADVKTQIRPNEWKGELFDGERSRETLAKGESAVFPIIGSTNVFKVRFICHRNDIPVGLQTVEEWNHSLIRFGVPSVVRVERLLVVDTLEINPLAQPGTVRADGEMRSDKDPTRVVRLMSVPKRKDAAP